MTDLAGRAELRAAAERAVFDAWAVRNGRQPTADESWWHIHRSGPTHTKWAADAVFDAIEPTLAAVEADRDRLQGDNAKWQQACNEWHRQRDEARAQLADARRVLNEKVAAARAEIGDLRAQLADAQRTVGGVRALLTSTTDSVHKREAMKSIDALLDRQHVRASRPSPDTTEATG